MIKQNIAQLLDAEMDRKDFLKMVGLGVVAATGVTQIIRSLSQNTQNKQKRTPIASGLDYGGSNYGGVVTKQK